MDALTEAGNIINGERQDSYGNPEDSFSIIAGYWTIYLEARCRGFIVNEPIVRPVDVANMMILFKQARKLGQKPCRDNYIDSIGYEAIAADRLIDWGLLDKSESHDDTITGQSIPPPPKAGTTYDR